MGKPLFTQTATMTTCTCTRIFKELDYGQIVKKRMNGRLVGKEKRTVIGNPNVKRIETYNIEDLNSILRNHLSGLVRKGKEFTKIAIRLRDALALFQFIWNFILTGAQRGVRPRPSGRGWIAPRPFYSLNMATVKYLMCNRLLPLG